MLVRLRSPSGQARVDADPACSLEALKRIVAGALSLDAADLAAFDLALDPGGSRRLNAAAGLFPEQPISGIGIKHGDMLFVLLNKSASATASGSAGSSANAADRTAQQQQQQQAVSHRFVKQDPVDDFLEKQEGTIKRGRDARFCKHGTSGMCEYCLPLQPYDAKYLEENKIKHMSFHAYLRLLTTQAKTAAATSNNFIPPLDIIDFKVKNPCPSKSHGPYPLGICTKCQPSAITLQSQNFRMVDHIEFESPAIIESLLQFWRASGIQRAGILYGRYEPYSEVPLGVKAVVSAIYEPPQTAAHDSIQLSLPDPEEASVDALAASLGLVRVGIIYTDLTDDGTGQGKVICKRHADSYFLSSAECIFASEYQTRYPVVTKYSPTGKFGSRFVTCVVSGNEENGIDIFSYQVSNTCVEMVQDKIIEASVNPSLMRVRESTDKQYVPEVFYKYKNEYNLMVKNAAKPTFPVEYLLVTVTHGFPSVPSPMFTNTAPFPPENRVSIGEPRDMSALKRLLAAPNSLQAVSDFHALLFIRELSVLEKDDFGLLVEAVKTQSQGLLAELAQRPSWQTFALVVQESAGTVGQRGGASTGSGGGGNAAPAAPKVCRHCTFVNAPGTETCDMCGLPPD